VKGRKYQPVVQEQQPREEKNRAGHENKTSGKKNFGKKKRNISEEKRGEDVPVKEYPKKGVTIKSRNGKQNW